jgi:hypothetical protein
MTPVWKCPRRIGFLFPHPCTRTTPVACPDCNGGLVNDPYRERSDRAGYEGDFDDYSLSDYSAPSSASFTGPAFGGGATADFTEADGASFADTGADFEDDMSAS